MAQHTRTYDNGAWVAGKDTDNEPFDLGMVTGFDEGDGQHMVMKADLTRRTGTEMWSDAWCEANDLSPADPPAELFGNPAPEHVFVIDWLDDGEPNFEVCADPDAVLTWLTDAGHVAPENLQLRLMECVSDPGERLSLNLEDFHVRFASVRGAER